MIRFSQFTKLRPHAPRSTNHARCIDISAVQGQPPGKIYFPLHLTVGRANFMRLSAGVLMDAVSGHNEPVK